MAEAAPPPPSEKIGLDGALQREALPEALRGSEAFNWLCGDFRSRYRAALLPQSKVRLCLLNDR